jgi:hypothetical protein
MIPRRIFLFTVVFFTCFGKIPAQDTLCSLSDTLNIPVRNDADGSGLSGNSNEMLKMISADAVKDLRVTGFDIQVKAEVRILRFQSVPVLDILLYPVAVSGDHHYRGFPLDDCLVPDSIAWGMVFYSRDSLPPRERAFPGILIPDSEGGFRFREAIPFLNSGIDSIFPGYPRGIYSSQALTTFRERIALIDDYYAACFLMDTLLAVAAQQEPPHLAGLPDLFLLLEEINRAAGLIGSRDFERILGLEEADPLGFRELYHEFTRYSRSASMTFLQRLDGPGISPDPGFPGKYPDAYLEVLMRYIRWSLLVNERNSDLFREMLDRFYTGNAIGNDTLLIQKLFYRMVPFDNPDSLMAALPGIFRDAFHGKAQALINQGRNAEALLLLENSRLLAEAIPGGRRLSPGQDPWLLAVNGIYESYLAIAANALSMHKLDFAETYLARAKQYRETNRSSPERDSLYAGIAEGIFEARSADCDTLAKYDHFEEALDCYSVLLSGMDSVADRIPAGKVSRKMLQVKYNLCLAAGFREFGKRNFTDAGEFFHNACTMRDMLFTDRDPVLDSMCRITYPYFLARSLEKNEFLIWTNRLDEAGAFADSIDGIQRTLPGEGDSALEEAILSYRRKFQAKVCWNLEESVNVLRVRAERLLEMKNYTRGCQLLDSAVAEAGTHEECNSPVHEIVEILMKYKVAGNYQQEIDQAASDATAGNYFAAVQRCIGSEILYEQNRIGQFGIEKLTLEDFIRQRNNPRLTLGAICFFDSTQAPDLAFRYLVLLKLQGYPAKETRSLQSELGNDLASLDFRNNPVNDPNMLVKQYTGNDKWYAILRSAYLYAWKKQCKKRTAKSE